MSSVNGNGNGNGKGDGGNHHHSAHQLAPRSEQIEQEIQAIGGRDFQLWSITLLVMVVLVAGFAALVAPNVAWKSVTLHTDSRYLPQLFFGLISLVVLFNVYVIAQKRELSVTRRALINELVFNERLEGLSLVDSLTQLLNRRALDQMLAKEVVRANRQGTPLTVVMIDLDDFKSINSSHGNHAGDELLFATAQLLRTTFRGSDMVFRYGGDEFLVVLPETTEPQAECALKRLLQELERWNLENPRPYEMRLTWGIGEHAIGSSITDLLQTANRKMFLRKHDRLPVF
jgi:diguanylate cyclase (GGDEF)-like protein